jgi:hypothetical protein
MREFEDFDEDESEDEYGDGDLEEILEVVKAVETSVSSIETNGKGQYVKLLTTTMYDIQELRKAVKNRIGDFVRKGGADRVVVAGELKKIVAETLVKLEDDFEKRVALAVADMPIITWLHEVEGIGPRLSGSLVAAIGDIKNFSTISRLNGQAGMGLIPICTECGKIAYRGEDRVRFCIRQANRRWRIYTSSKEYKKDLKEGKAKDEETYKKEKYDYTQKQLCQHEGGQFPVEDRAPQRRYFEGLLLTHNPFLKMTMWKISGQFAKQGKFYRMWYERYKAKYVERDGGRLTKGHVDLRARRALAKLFLSHLWTMWRASEGLPAGKIYLQEKLGMDFETHEYIEPPYKDIYE